MKFKQCDKVKTLFEKEGVPIGTTGIIVSFYGKNEVCEVELLDKDDYPVDVVTYKFNEIKKFEN